MILAVHAAAQTGYSSISGLSRGGTQFRLASGTSLGAGSECSQPCHGVPPRALRRWDRWQVQPPYAALTTSQHKDIKAAIFSLLASESNELGTHLDTPSSSNSLTSQPDCYTGRMAGRNSRHAFLTSMSMIVTGDDAPAMRHREVGPCLKALSNIQTSWTGNSLPGIPALSSLLPE